MMVLTPAKIDALLRGASLLACGGGLKFTEQKRLVKGKKAKLIRPNELKGSDWCATVSEVGAAAAPVMDKSRLPRAIKLLETKSGKKITALIPPEIGQEAIVIDAANRTGLPIVDSDLAGGRAVPRLNDLALVVQGLAFTISPAVVMTAAGKISFIPQLPNLDQDESRIRRLVPKNQVVTLTGGMINGRTVNRYLNYSSLTRTIKLGLALQTGKPLLSVLPTPLLLPPIKVTVTAIKRLSVRGFDAKAVTLASLSGRLKLKVENEYMSLKLQGKVFSFPKLIMLFDRKQGRGIHSSELKIDKSYNLIVAAAFSFWKEKL